MSLIQHALSIVSVFISWFMLPHFRHRILCMSGLVGLLICLLIIRGLGSAPSVTGISWAIGSIFIAYPLVCDVTVGPICYAIVSEVPLSELRSKTVALSRMTYSLLNIVSNVITPYMLNPGAWTWGARTGFFFAGTCTISLICTAFHISETKGRTYSELNVLFLERTRAWGFKGEEVNVADSSETTEREDL